MFRRAQIVLGSALLVAVALASSSAGQGTPPGQDKDKDKAIAAKEKHAAKLLDKPGVVGIGVGVNGAGKPIIKVYKDKADVEDIPEELDGVPVDSVVTGVIEGALPLIASLGQYRSGSRRATTSSPRARSEYA